MSGSEQPTRSPYDPAVSSSIAAGLRLALGEAAGRYASVLVHDATTNRWTRIAGALVVSDDELQELASELRVVGSGEQVLGGRVAGYPLCSERGLLGALVVATESDLLHSAPSRPVLDD